MHADEHFLTKEHFIDFLSLEYFDIRKRNDKMYRDRFCFRKKYKQKCKYVNFCVSVLQHYV